ncbi:hypothetical protein [Pseudonocardia oceani]|uniref:hypothetical protein n=1 Tax=Pseudonocardia oceani TaxID=2792013 RepID=UPI001CECB50C|nr:hypothetical protein [Pseudonocardia oceani]
MNTAVLLRVRNVLPQIVVLVWLPVCFVLGMANRSLLPPRFFFDDRHIQDEMLTAAGPSSDSFITMAWLYRLMGADDHPTAVQAATMIAFFVLLFTCAPWSQIRAFGIVETGVLCFAAVSCAVYLAQYSKESLVLLLVLVLMSSMRWSSEVFFVVLVFLYAAFIRPYWFMIIAVYLVLRLLFKQTRRPIWLLLTIAIGMFAFAVTATAVLNVDLNSFRDSVASSRVNSIYAQSAIQDYVSVSGPVSASVNALVSMVLLMVPVPLLADLSAIYLVFSVLTAGLWLLLTGVIVSGMRSGRLRGDTRLARACALLLAMVTVQAIFEPDYGSYLKHLTPLLPLFLVALVRHRARPSQSEPTYLVATAQRRAALFEQSSSDRHGPSVRPHHTDRQVEQGGVRPADVEPLRHHGSPLTFHPGRRQVEDPS